MSNPTSVVVGLLVLAWICFRQVRPRPVRQSARVPLVLGAIGLVETVQLLQSQTTGTVSPVALGLLVVSLAVGAGLAVVRARQMHVWRDGAVVMQRGNAATVVLWVVAVVVHLGVDALADHADPGLAGLGSASILLYLGCVLGVQQVVLQRRAATLVPA